MGIGKHDEEREVLAEGDQAVRRVEGVRPKRDGEVSAESKQKQGHVELQTSSVKFSNTKYQQTVSPRHLTGALSKSGLKICVLHRRQIVFSYCQAERGPQTH